MPLSSPTIAVLDVETTGMFPFRTDRVVEIAAIVIDLDGNFLHEFATLINPDRSVGPSWVHGVKAKDVSHAPRFGEIANALAEALAGTVALAGHNVGFDLNFLKSEYEKIGFVLPKIPLLDTLKLAGGGKLAVCCRNYGVEPDGPLHHALTDVRMTAKLLGLLLSKRQPLKNSLKRHKPIAWPKCDLPQKHPTPRGALRPPAERPKETKEPTLFDFLDNREKD